MAFKLTKPERTRKAELQEALTAAREVLDAKVEDVNDAVQTAIDALMETVAEYNAVIEDARGFVADIVAQADEDFGDKSERWQEGERGELAREWIDQWEQASLDDIDLPEIELVAVDGEDHADALDQLANEAEF